MHVTLCLTHDCTLRCAYCYAGNKHKRAMSRETALQAIHFGIERALLEPKKHLTMGFFGGEPLMCWDFLVWAHGETVRCAKAAGVRTSFTVTTNLTLVDKAKADWLVEHGFSLGLSLDGNADMHNHYRVYPDGSPSHADCVRGLKFLTNRGAKGEIIAVYHPVTVRHLFDSVKYLAENFGFMIALNPDFSAEWEDDDLVLLEAQYRAIGEYYLHRYRKGAPIRINWLDGKIRTHLKGGYSDCDKCTMGSGEIAVAASGNLYPCARLVGNDDDEAILLGNVETGYDEAALRRIVSCRGNRNEACHHCPVRHRCMCWCGCVNYVQTGDIGIVGAFNCFHERLSVEISDSIADTLWTEQNPWFIARFYKSVIKNS